MSVQVSYHQTSLPQHTQCSELPENDVGLVSYYLNCCVAGCGIPVDVPSNLLDFANATRLPQEYQHAIYSVAIHVFQLENLLNRIIFIDDHCDILPQNSPNMFIPSQQAAQLAHLVPAFAGIPSTSGKIMICTSEWLNTFYMAPVARYSQAVLRNTTPQAQANFSHQPLDSKATHHCQDFGKKEQYEARDVHVEADDCEDIPMAVAVPIDEPQHSRQDELSVSFFLPGQFVKLSGLVYSSMNDELAVVEERSQDRVLVRIPGDPRRYSVRPENLVVVEGNINVEALATL